MLSISQLNVQLAGFIQSVLTWNMLLVCLFSFMSLDSSLVFFSWNSSRNFPGYRVLEMLVFLLTWDSCISSETAGRERPIHRDCFIFLCYIYVRMHHLVDSFSDRENQLMALSENLRTWKRVFLIISSESAQHIDTPNSNSQFFISEYTVPFAFQVEEILQCLYYILFPNFIQLIERFQSHNFSTLYASLKFKTWSSLQ